MAACRHTLGNTAGLASEFGGLWVAASRSRGVPRWQAEGVENLSDYDRILDGCQNAHSRAAARKFSMSDVRGSQVKLTDNHLLVEILTEDKRPLNRTLHKNSAWDW
jgi:hypothetical protein